MKEIKELAESVFTNDSYEYEQDKYIKIHSELYKKANKALNDIIEFKTRVKLESENRFLKHKKPLRYEDYKDYKVCISSILMGQTIEGVFKTKKIDDQEKEEWLCLERTEYLLSEAEEIIRNCPQ